MIRSTRIILTRRAYITHTLNLPRLPQMNKQQIQIKYYRAYKISRLQTPLRMMHNAVNRTMLYAGIVYQKQHVLCYPRLVPTIIIRNIRRLLTNLMTTYPSDNIMITMPRRILLLYLTTTAVMTLNIIRR